MLELYRNQGLRKTKVDNVRSKDVGVLIHHGSSVMKVLAVLGWEPSCCMSHGVAEQDICGASVGHHGSCGQAHGLFLASMASE